MGGKGKKRKTVIQGSTSQVQDPGYDSVRFRSEGCEKFHNSINVNTKFIREKALFIAPGECEEIRENIRHRGWERYVEYPKEASKALVFEFFSNVFPKTDIDGPVTFKKSTSYVRGRTVAFDSETINSLFGLQPVPILDDLLRNKVNIKRLKENPERAAEICQALCTPGMDWVRNARGEPQKFLTSSLTPVAKGWASFIVSTILPSPCQTELGFERAVLAGCIIRGEPVNLGWVIEKEIKRFAEFKGGAVPSYWRYASLIALLCENAGVVAEAGEATVLPAVAITGNWMRSRTGLEHPVHMEEPQQEQPDEHEPTFNIDDFAVGPSAEDFQSLRERMDTMVANQGQIIANQQQMRADLEQVRGTQAEMREEQVVMRRNQERLVGESRFGMRALYRAIASQSGGQLDPHADIFQPLRAPQPPQPPQQ